MKKAILFMGLIIGAVITFSSCGQKGCTDSDATNFCSKCKIDDEGECQFEGSVVFWLTKRTTDSLVKHGATGLTYYVAGGLVGTSDTSVYWLAAPGCEQSGSIAATKPLGNEKSKSFSYSVKDQAGTEYWSGTLIFSADECTAKELVW